MTSKTKTFTIFRQKLKKKITKWSLVAGHVQMQYNLYQMKTWAYLLSVTSSGFKASGPFFSSKYRVNV